MIYRITVANADGEVEHTTTVRVNVPENAPTLIADALRDLADAIDD